MHAHIWIIKSLGSWLISIILSQKNVHARTSSLIAIHPCISSLVVHMNWVPVRAGLLGLSTGQPKSELVGFACLRVLFFVFTGLPSLPTVWWWLVALDLASLIAWPHFLAPLQPFWPYSSTPMGCTCTCNEGGAGLVSPQWSMQAPRKRWPRLANHEVTPTTSPPILSQLLIWSRYFSILSRAFPSRRLEENEIDSRLLDS